MVDIADAERKEKVRKQIVNLIFVVYGLLIFEGALRKWFFPQFNRYLYFIKDPFVLWVYLLAWKNQMWPKKMPLLSYGIFLSVAAIFFIFINSLTGTMPLIVQLYGWRMYFLYLPLVFIIGEQFRGKDLKRLAKYTLLAAIPMALLVYKQVHSPVTSFINKSVETGIFYTETGLRGGAIIRTTGTFTFFHGYQIFLGSVIAFCFISWILSKKERPLSVRLLITASLATLACFAMDITRLPTFLAAFILLASLYSSTLLKDQRKRIRARVFSSLLVILGIIFIVRYFAGLHEVRTKRFDSEYLKARSTGMITNFVPLIAKAPLFGYGLGAATRGGQVLGANGVKEAGENEWRRIIAEAGPLLGFMYIIFRIWLVAWLFKGAVLATKRSDNPFPLLLLGFIGPIIFIWYITGKGSVHGYGWLFAGFCMAANRLGPGTWETKEDAAETGSAGTQEII